MNCKILLLFSIFVFLFSVKNINSLSSNIANQTSNNTFNGYIVEFKDTPLLVYQNELKNNIKIREQNLANSNILYKYTFGLVESQFINADKNAIPAKVTGQASTIQNEHNLLKGYIRGNEKILAEYSNIYNGMALNISGEDAKSLSELDYVKDVYPNYQVKTLLMDSVPLIGADKVWQLSDSLGNNITGKGVVVAVIDTGVDYANPELGGCFGLGCKVASGYDFVNGDNDPMDDNGHGTHVAGIIAANGTLKGIAPDATLYAYKVLDSSGSGWYSTVIAGVNQAVADKVNVISMSLGAMCGQYSSDCGPDDPLSQALDNAVDSGIVAVIAAGNSGPQGSSIGSPGVAYKVITVGATYKKDYTGYYWGDYNPTVDQITIFSSRGPVKTPDSYTIKPDIVAPGAIICSTRFDNIFPTGTNPYYYPCVDDKHVQLAGTSMATPEVAGAVALILQAHKDWNPEQVKLALRSTAVDIHQPINVQGYGRINALKAVQLSGEPPIAELNTSGTVYNNAIIGTASSDNFKNYTLYVGNGFDPAVWNEICSSSSQVVDGVLCSNFDSALPDGDYSLRLVVFDNSGLPSEDRTLITISNVGLSNPLDDDIYRAGDIIAINGTIKSATFQNYVLEYSLSSDQINWHSDGITLVNGGKSSIINGKLADWNTSSVIQADFYTIRLTANYEGFQNIVYIKNVYIDPTLKKGWPVRINFDVSNGFFAQVAMNGFYSTSSIKVVPQANGKANFVSNLGSNSRLTTVTSASATVTYDSAGFLEPVVSDIDKDGQKEIIIYQQGNPPKLLVYRNDGTLYWSKNIGTAEWADGNLMPVVADIDNDGYNEIIVFSTGGFTTAYSELYAFHYDGSLVSGFPVQMPKDYHPTMIAADLFQDGKNEIIVKGNSPNSPQSPQMVIVSGSGKIISEWNITHGNWGGSIESLPAVGNFDNDKQLEIVVAGPSEKAGYNFTTNEWINDGVIYVYKANGTVVSGWPVHVNGEVFSSPVVGDINGDGKNEIVVGLLYASDIFPDTRYGGLYAFDNKGNVLPGWPVLVGYNFWSTPSLVDYYGDGKLEIAASRLGFVTYVFNYNGTVANGWPQYTEWNDYYSTVIGDVNGDGHPDIVTTAGGAQSSYYHGGVYAWNFDGTQINGFPKVTEVDAQAPATIAELSNDGKVYLVASSDLDFDWVTQQYKMRGDIYVWDLQAGYNPSTMFWPTYHHDNKLTGLYSTPVVLCSIPNSALCSVNSICQCSVTNCQNGWLRARLPDNTEFAKYFTSSSITFNSGTKLGTANAYISCRDDGKEYNVSIQIR